MRIAVTGSSGLVGRALGQALAARGDQVIAVRRGPGGGLLEPRDGGGLDGVVHLAGEPIAARRWSVDVKREIEESRVKGTRALVESIGKLARPPRVLVSASAVAIYGPACGDQRLDESDVPEAALGGRVSDDFLTRVATGWEREAFGARAAGVPRVVTLRIGIVLSPDGGALERLLPIFRLGLGGRLGTGCQWMSWIALDDLVGAILLSLDHPKLDGPVNAVSPTPLTNAEFTRELATALRRPAMLPVPALALRVAVGEFAPAALLASHRVVPQKLIGAGFSFACPELPGALRYVGTKGD